MAPYVTNEVEIDDDNLFAPLQSTVQRPFYSAEVPIDARPSQSMKSGDNCAG